MLEKIVDSEVGDSGGGVCLLFIEPGDSIDRRVNLRLPSNPCRLSE